MNKKIFTLTTGKNLLDAKLSIRYKKLALILVFLAPVAIFYGLWLQAISRLRGPAPEWGPEDR